MPTYIEVAVINILNGLLAGTIPFNPGLNIISGENGTLKTKLLREIKAGHYQPNPGAPNQPRIQAISPKRNSERRAVESIIQFMRQQNKNFDTYISERGGIQINDNTFENYPSLGELFYFVYEHRCKDGGSQVEHMSTVTVDFNGIISEVFPEYRLHSDWNSGTGSPNLRLIKKRTNEVPLEALSLGEQEVLALITNLFASHDAYDVFLIDEPEVHLNWHLEERLFEYLDNFCNRYSKQIIVVTHSRVIFLERFLSKTIFFHWNDQGHVEWGKELSPEQRRRIAGEAIEIVRLGDLPSRTFFVEDNEQEVVIRTLARSLDSQVTVTVCGNAPNVRSLFKRSRNDGSWGNAFFVEDGDNENSPFPNETQFIHLDKYCIENYLLDFDLGSTITGKSHDNLREILFQAVLANKDRILGKSKFLAFLVDQIHPKNLTSERLAKLDASLVFQQYLRAIDHTFENYVEKYVAEAKRRGVINQIFPEQLVQVIQGAA